MNNDTHSHPAALAPSPSSAYSNYVLAIMTIAYMIAFLDRQIPAILMPQLKAEFGLSDFELALLVGPAFAIIYSVLGIPLAIIGDRFNRRNLVALSVGIFSVMTLASGFVTHFWQLLVARLGVGVGQSGTSPSINSMLSDLFEPKRRAAAFAIYTMGANVGILMLIVAGYGATHYGWRMTMIVAAIPGLLLTMLIMATVSEPTRGRHDVSIAGSDEPAPTIGQSLRYFMSNKTYVRISLGVMISSAGGYAFTSFIPTFLVRSHGLSVQDAGLVFALLFGGASAIGVLIAGMAASRMAQKEISRSLRVPVITLLISAPFVPVFLLSENIWLAIAAAITPAALNAAHVGPSFSAIQGVAPLRMRAFATALFLFNINIVGFGIGPVVIGFASDALRPVYHDDSLRMALLIAVATLLIGAWMFWRAIATYQLDIEKAAAYRSEPSSG